MVEHTVLTPEVIATIIGLIVLVGGGTALGIMRALRGYLLKGKTFLDTLIDALEDDSLSPEEIKRLWDALLKILEKDPNTAKVLLNRFVAK